jgi:phosphoribosyl 1,2-cyclic phosphodiesterase
MRFCSLGSGSTGNATLVETGAGPRPTRLLIDCGFAVKELTRRLAQRTGLGLADLDAVFITHEHGDHVGCALGLARRHGLPLWMSEGTWRAIGAPDLPAGQLVLVHDGARLALKDLELRPYTVPHDAAEPLQLVLHDGAARLGVLTDAGSATPHLLTALAGCDALLLECNHDRDLLAASSYPAFLKARVGGRFGHLANETAGQILAALRHSALQHVVAAHLSEQNNRPALAAAVLATALGCAPHDIGIADPRDGFDWRSIV